MKSPFPGMDPYLESRWSDVHSKLIAFLGEALQLTLPTGLRARSEERVLLETVEHEPVTTYRSDVAVLELPRGRRPRAGGVATTPSAATIEPVVVQYYAGPEVDRFIHIIDIANHNRIVTAIEVLSPWNKGPGRLNADYRRKLDDYARGEVSVVEIDLLRSSRGRLPVGQEDLQPVQRTPYLVCVRRAWRPSQWELYPISLRDRLPRIPVPLREKDAAVTVDLQPLIERVYIAGGHDDIDYRRPPDPPLDPADAAWARGVVKAARKR